MSQASPFDFASALSGSRLVIFLKNTWRGDDPEALASRTRALYLDYISNSSVGLFISLALYLSWPGMSWAFLQGFMVIWIFYLISRLIAGIVFASRKSMSVEALRLWSRLPILIQLIDGVMLSVLCLCSGRRTNKTRGRCVSSRVSCKARSGTMMHVTQKPWRLR
jgi:hypothetical protein